jgi:cereblon
MNEEYRPPLQLSYWLSSNMALQQHEKLWLLQMMSPVERLQWILRKLRESEKAETVFQCKRCGCPITRGSQAFTVGGSQGTTGNCTCAALLCVILKCVLERTSSSPEFRLLFYARVDVNEHGHVHQTMTFRTIDEDEVTLTGSAETRDSWFPGYSWTIMSCGFCQAHLGWKFQLVGADDGRDTEDRPPSFFGLSASQVATVVPETHRARRHSRGPFRH